jgi:hypothetical protein
MCEVKSMEKMAKNKNKKIKYNGQQQKKWIVMNPI